MNEFWSIFCFIIGIITCSNSKKLYNLKLIKEPSSRYTINKPLVFSLLLPSTCSQTWTSYNYTLFHNSWINKWNYFCLKFFLLYLKVWYPIAPPSAICLPDMCTLSHNDLWKVFNLSHIANHQCQEPSKKSEVNFTTVTLNHNGNLRTRKTNKFKWKNLYLSFISF